MSFRPDIDERNNKFFIQQKNYVNVSNDIIKIRNTFSENGVYEFPYTGNIVEFTVHTTGTYKIEAWGAMGGGGSTLMGPKGAYSKSFVLLSKDERIKILVGEKGYPGYNSGNSIYCGGGGGGTFIAKDRTPLCVAGGGGSLVYYTYDGTSGSWGKGGNSFVNGGARQTSRTYENSAYGGFGGGASHHGHCGHAAGGGGYTGGSASSSDSTQGGGGGSYFEGFYNNEVSEAISGCNVSLPTNPGTNGNGFALLTLLTHIPSATAIKCATCSHNKGRILWIYYVTFISQ
jgi:hypothetical protein